MMQSAEDLPSDLKWQVTATTIWCPSGEVRTTLIVRSDWDSYCTCYKEFKKEGTNPLPEKCKGPVCDHIKDYKGKLIFEETGNNKK